MKKREKKVSNLEILQNKKVDPFFNPNFHTFSVLKWADLVKLKF